MNQSSDYKNNNSFNLSNGELKISKLEAVKNPLKKPYVLEMLLPFQR